MKFDSPAPPNSAGYMKHNHFIESHFSLSYRVVVRSTPKQVGGILHNHLSSIDSNTWHCNTVDVVIQAKQFSFRRNRHKTVFDDEASIETSCTRLILNTG